MEDLKTKVLQGIDEISREKVDILSQLWSELFEKDIGREHLRKLLDHVEAFYTDIITETEERKISVIERIKSLQKEKDNLKRLLKEDVEEVPNDVPLYTLTVNIDDSLKNLREKLQKRRQQIEEFINEQNVLCDELGENPRPLSTDPLPSEEEMDLFADHIESLRDMKYSRLEEIMDIRQKTEQVIEKLELKFLDPYDDNLLHSNDLKPTKNNIQKLQDLFELFESQLNKMKYQIEDMRKRLKQLWKYLDIPEEYQKKFQKYTECNQTNYDKLFFEVERCEQIKKENIRVFIEKVRMEIEEYWEKCLKSDAERLRFQTFTANTFNEDVLEMHEDELRALKLFYETNESIFKLIHERQTLWNQMELLQNKEQDPKRYANRGGQLLKEEKERKMISSKLPKIEARLIEMVEAFEAQNKRPFTIFGVPVQDTIEREYEAKRQEKLTKSGKKVQATPAKTPMRANITGFRTPLTVEQTIINRTNIKTTGGRLKVAMQHHQKTLSSTNSSVASVRSVRTENGKRKVPYQIASAPPAKRKLINAFASPAPCNALKPRNDNTAASTSRRAGIKNTSIKVYNVGAVIKRRSKSRKSINKRRKSRVSRVPCIEVTETNDEDAPTDTTNYEGFENYVYQSKSVVRSSEVVRPHFLAVNHHGFASPLLKKSTPKRNATPSSSTPAKNMNNIQPKELEFSMII